MSAPAPGVGFWRVRILDLSGAELASGELAGGEAENVVEVIGGFATLSQANDFARRYVRDSIERCRRPGSTAQDVLDAWLAYGEDAEIAEGGEEAWRSGPEIGDFAARKATPDERDWRALDPRRGARAEEGDS
ncbi:MAG: hypothetical protein KGJ41_06365 [Rhodospirillales bacterium]|nr:hypothetical protein [Rhodospirillales bacterium]MDE2198626.1 hypothetical protein [Rhodospirillales bacterium]MDE2574013.1 hypothetical protein [Rhodospirillales bacterium]